jgi:hypothetical protein
VLRIATALVSCALAIFAERAIAQSTPAIRVIRSSQVSTANPRWPHFESWLALDPRDAAHMIAASMVGRPNGKLGSNVYVTFDSGRHWSASRIAPRDSALFIGGDPIVHITRQGSALFGTGSRVDGKPASVVSRSTDGGRSWGNPQALHYRDRAYMAFDTTGSRLDGTIYFAGQFGPFLLSHSADDGRSFSYPQLLTRDLGGADPTFPIRGLLTDMLVTPDGVLVLPFASEVDPRDSIPKAETDSLVTLMFRVLVSDDGGRSFLAVREGPHMHSKRGFRGSQAVSAPRTALDQSRGAYRGRLYLVWTDWDSERKTYMVRLFRSSDLGKTWTSTIVNDNTNGRDPGNPAIAVNRDGIVGVIWNDRREDPDNQCWRLYGAVSTNGGETFLPNVKLSDAPTCTNAPGNWVLNAWDQYDNWTTPSEPRPGFGVTANVAVRFPNGGDTQGLVADADGTFHAAWINGATGTLQLWYTAFTVDSQLVSSARGRNAAHLTTTTAVVPAGKVDVTQELTFEVSRPTIDFARGTLEVAVRVVNPTTRPMREPIDIILERLTRPGDKPMGLVNFKPANADNGGAGIGAVWTFNSESGEILAPKGKTLPKVLRFTFTGGVPHEPEGYFEPTFRILAREAQRNR